MEFLISCSLFLVLSFLGGDEDLGNWFSFVWVLFPPFACRRCGNVSVLDRCQVLFVIWVDDGSVCNCMGSLHLSGSHNAMVLQRNKSQRIKCVEVEAKMQREYRGYCTKHLILEYSPCWRIKTFIVDWGFRRRNLTCDRHLLFSDSTCVSRNVQSSRCDKSRP